MCRCLMRSICGAGMRGHATLVIGGAEWRLLLGGGSQRARFDRTIAWVPEPFGWTACEVFCGMHAASELDFLTFRRAERTV